MQILPGNEFLLSAVQDKMDADGDLTDNKVVEWLDHCVADYLKFAHQLAAND
ncbi:NADPH-dependent FMN reductase family protein [Lactiplantibacillus plantarum]|nr:NADPH-dependent FMN reductase family protein [Lactiplantibacillus plantarum]VDH10840.1 NADPH-dependent FMN reductase family protein [Lactiplantibacillus plantarum]